jgi:hypothetical protein
MEALGPSHPSVRVACTVMCGKASRSNEPWRAELPRVDPRGGRAAQLPYSTEYRRDAPEHDTQL